MSDGVRFFSAGALSVFAIILFAGLVILILPLLILGMVGAAFTRLGFSWIAALAVILLILFGSFVNIPVYRLRRDMIRVNHGEASVYGAGAPPQLWETIISLNLGGAVIPVCLSLYLLYRAFLITGTSLFIPVCGCVTLVAIITFISSRPLTGVGMRVPLIIPGLTALLSGMLIAGGVGLTAAVTAFVGGTAGTLLGGNIAHLSRINDLEVPEVTIGGAGTFGAVLVCCILPTLIA